jgi:hypothetical protein
LHATSQALLWLQNVEKAEVNHSPIKGAKVINLSGTSETKSSNNILMY